MGSKIIFIDAIVLPTNLQLGTSREKLEDRTKINNYFE